MACSTSARVFRLCVALLFIQLSTTSLFAQKPFITFRHFSDAEGLSQNHVNCIIQDRQGFMWFGTSEGLNRFDGYDFTIYRHVDGDTSSIPSDNITELFLDKEGQIWIGSSYGLAKYNRNLDTFTSFVPDATNEASVSTSQVNRIIEDKAGNFWIAFLNGVVDYFDRNMNTFTHFQISSDANGSGKFGEAASSLVLDRNGNLWIGTFQGITVLNDKREIIKKFNHDPGNVNSLGSDKVHDIIEDRYGSIWVATEHGLNKYEHGTGDFVRFMHDDKNENSLSTEVVRRILEDREGRIWIGTENGGLDILDHKANRFYHFIENKSFKSGISDNSIYSIYRDRLDNMWVGTNVQGVNFYDRYARPFKLYQSSPGVKGQLNYDKINGVDEQPGKGLWIATEGGGLNFLDEEKDRFTAYMNDPNDPSSIPGNFTGDVIWDSARHCVWITTWGGGLWRMDPTTGRGKTYRNNPRDSTSLAGNYLWRLYMKDGVLYVGTVGDGLSIYNDRTDSFSSYSLEDGLADKNVISIYADKKGFLWTGGWELGISKMNLSQRKFVPAPEFTNMSSVFSIKSDSLDRLWFSNNDGILIYDEKNDSVTTFTIKDGLPGRSVHGMLDDGKGNYWLSTNAGLVRFDVAQKEFRTFTMADGLPTNQFSSWPLRAKDGRMFFGSAKGLIAFHPDSMKINPVIPKVYITDLKIFNESVPIGGEESILTRPISETKSITLPYDHNVFSLTFVGLNYTSSTRNQYAYRLEGFDKGWTQAQSNRMATYTSLDPGTYTFKVKASNNDGLWNDEGATLIIHVLPPWWQTWWFRSILAVFSIFVVVLITYVRTRNIQRSNRVLEETVRQKTNALMQNNQEILAQKEEIDRKNKMLVEQAEQLAKQNEALIQIQEEVSSQRDLLSHQNENLEQQVEKRTKELKEHTKQLEQFAFISAHNLRAPVARILGLGHLLDITADDPSRNDEIYPRLIQTTKELDNVVKDLNSILDLKQSNDSLITTIELDKVLASTMKTLDKEITLSHASVSFDFSQANTIRTVKAYLDSILYNLISNAIKYKHSDREPVINIKSEQLEKEICLIVEDNGLGIDLELYRDKLFNLYSRLHFHVEGKGMGLYLVKTQMTSIGGRIEVASKVAVGTVFKLYFKR